MRVIIRIRSHRRRAPSGPPLEQLLKDDSGALYGEAQPLPAPRELFYWILAGMLLLSFLAGTLIRPWWRSSSTPATIVLQTVEQDGKILIRWDPTEAAVRQARRAFIEIRDGGTETLLECGAECLAAGQIAYAPSSESVDVRIQLFLPNSASAFARTLHIGKKAPAGLKAVQP